MEGKGTLTFPDKSFYEGDFKADKMDGKGVFVAADGKKTAGTFKNGRFAHR